MSEVSNVVIVILKTGPMEKLYDYLFIFGVPITFQKYQENTDIVEDV